MRIIFLPHVLRQSHKHTPSPALSAEHGPYRNAQRFISRLLELTTVECGELGVQIREAVKESLGQELSPTLYPMLMEQITHIVQVRNVCVCVCVCERERGRERERERERKKEREKKKE